MILTICHRRQRNYKLPKADDSVLIGWLTRPNVKNPTQ
jgi:hypothetical protein